MLTFKRITILLLTDSTAGVKRITMPRLFLNFLAILFVFCVGVLSWTIADYMTIKAQGPLLARLQKETEHKARQFVHLAERVKQITQKMSELQELNHKLKVMANLDQSDGRSGLLGVGGSQSVKLPIENWKGANKNEFVQLMHHSLDGLQNQMATCKTEKTRLHEFFINQKMLLAATPSLWPARGWVSSRFGTRISPFSGKKEFHEGIDISARINSPVVAPADGVVSSVCRDRRSGNVLLIDHGYGFRTIYAHLQKAIVKKGRHLKRGETIALVGNTGRSTGPHVHYEVHFNGVPVNPFKYVPGDVQLAESTH